MSVPTRAEIDGRIAAAIAADPSFRGRLVAAPRAALSELLGLEVPEMVTITVHEESLTDLHLVLPAEQPAQLLDSDLELVGGGGCWTDPTCYVPSCAKCVT